MYVQLHKQLGLREVLQFVQGHIVTGGRAGIQTEKSLVLSHYTDHYAKNRVEARHCIPTPKRNIIKRVLYFKI